MEHGNFNSHAHVERDTATHTEIADAMNFNSHAHVERDGLSYVSTSGGRISTHTLTWSVTSRTGYSLYAMCISTHTLTWSVTKMGEI